jgi:hypothetical protein
VISPPDSGPHITAAQVHIRWIFRQDYRHPCPVESCPVRITRGTPIGRRPTYSHRRLFLSESAWC